MTSIPPKTVEKGLTKVERGRLNELERAIERGLKTFVEVGRALTEVRDKRLYRAQFSTFEDYCAVRWDLVRQSAYRQIDAAKVFDNLASLSPNGDKPAALLPLHEFQARALTRLDPAAQREVWSNLTVDGKQPTGDAVAQAVDAYESEHRKLTKSFQIAEQLREQRPQEYKYIRASAAPENPRSLNVIRAPATPVSTLPTSYSSKRSLADRLVIQIMRDLESVDWASTSEEDRDYMIEAFERGVRALLHAIDQLRGKPS